MKILMVAQGTVVHARRTLDLLLARKCEIAFVDRHNPKPEGAPGFEFIDYPQAIGWRFLRRLVGRPTANRWATQRIVSQLQKVWRRTRPDVTHVHWVDQRASQCVLAGLKPLVLTAWGTDINQHFLPEADPRDREIVGQTLAAADLILVDAADIAEKCARLAGRAVPVRLLSLGVDTRLFRPGLEVAAGEWRKRLEVPADAFVFLSNRAWERRYGHHLILEAFARAVPCFKKQACLVFKLYNKRTYQTAEAYELEVRRQAQQLGVERFIRWAGEIELAQLPEIYALADVVVNYPCMDAFPVTFLEAAACERPVLSCRLPAYLGTFAEQYFRLVPPEQVAELAAAMVDTVNAPPSPSAPLLAEARRLVADEYDESVCITRLLGLYDEVVAGRSLKLGRSA